MRLDYKALVSIFAALVVGPVASTRAADIAWLDIESRIQYGYFVEDDHALRNLMEPLVSGEQQDPLKSYYAALLAYRLSLLDTAEPAPAGSQPVTGGNKPTTGGNKTEARQMAQRCVASLDHALQLRNDFPDALALQSACLGRLAELSSLPAPLAGSRSSTKMRKALQLAPKNPRVLLLDASSDSEHPEVLGGDAADTCGKLKKAVAAFEVERAGVDQVPGWGAADAYVWLAQCYLNRDDAISARDALERALLIAPEFSRARRMLARITAG